MQRLHQPLHTLLRRGAAWKASGRECAQSAQQATALFLSSAYTSACSTSGGAWAPQLLPQQQQQQQQQQGWGAAGGSQWRASWAPSRGFASKRPNAAADLRKQQQAPSTIARLDLETRFTDLIVDPWPGPAGKDWGTRLPFTKQGRNNFMAWFRHVGMHTQMWAVLNQCVPGHSNKELQVTVAQMYQSINAAIANNELWRVQDVVAPKELMRMQVDIDRRMRQAGWAEVEWALAEPLHLPDITVVHRRGTQLHPKARTIFLQLTLRIPSRQRFVVRDVKGRLVAGDEREALDVVDYWVIERKAFNKTQQGLMSSKSAANMMDVPGARWRLVARLSFDDQQRSKERVEPWWRRWLAPFRPASGTKEQQPATAEM